MALSPAKKGTEFKQQEMELEQQCKCWGFHQKQMESLRTKMVSEAATPLDVPLFLTNKHADMIHTTESITRPMCR